MKKLIAITFLIIISLGLLFSAPRDLKWKHPITGAVYSLTDQLIMQLNKASMNLIQAAGNREFIW